MGAILVDICAITPAIWVYNAAAWMKIFVIGGTKTILFAGDFYLVGE